MAEVVFDLRRLYEAIDSERGRLELSWAALGRSVGVAASTIRRFAEADDAEADGVLALIRWLDVAPEEFVTGGVVDGKRLVPSGDGFVRVDMDLVATAAGDGRRAAGRTRTTIQRIVSAAQVSGQPVASLTRLSSV